MANDILKEVVTQQVQRMCFEPHPAVTISDWRVDSGGVQLGQVTINTLSDDALLYVFCFYVAGVEWRTLVHVCQRWRTLVFASSRRLNLRISCTRNIPVKELDVWRHLPIAISNYGGIPKSAHCIKAALEHHERVCEIKLHSISGSELAEVFAALEAPFPVLTDLYLASDGSTIIPNPEKSFHGSTSLQSLSFSSIPVPGLPGLLLSSTNLRVVNLYDIPSFSPREMVTALSALTRLEALHIIGHKGEPDQLNLDRESQHSPLPPRAILPSLTVFEFEAFSEYLEDFMARIDAPLLNYLNISFICSSVDQDSDIELETPQLLRFISYIPKFQAPDKAFVGMGAFIGKFWISFSWPTPISSALRLEVHHPYAEQHMSHLAQFCRSPLFPLPTLEHLYTCGGGPGGDLLILCRQGYTRWLELFQPFTAVKNLYLSKSDVKRVTPALQNLVGDRAMEVLPALEKFFISGWLSGPVHEAIEQFAAARQLSGHPIVISPWNSA